jgi:hypothetical protein
MRKVNKESVEQFQNKFHNETWENIDQLNNVNVIFNLFLNAYSLVFQSCFFKQRVTNRYNDNGSITAGIHISCRHKESLFILNRNINNHLFKPYYRSYCIILRRVIRDAKRKYYNCLITAAENKIKTTWNIIDIETGQKNNNNKEELCLLGCYAVWLL